MQPDRALRVFIALVWFIMGLGCKVLGLVPRHQEIVARILGEGIAPTLTVLIGVSEIGMAVWVLSGIKPRLCAYFQITLVAVMNLLEFILARDLLLFGALNALVAIAFIAIIAVAERLRVSKC